MGIIDPNTEMKIKIDAVLADISQLPAMPSIAQKAMMLSSDPDADFNVLAEELSKDPGITTSVLRISNSAYYSPSRKIRSVHEAIVVLGTKTLKNIILVIASKGILSVPLEGYKLDGSMLWDHSLAAAEFASRIAKISKAVPEDVAFTAGLLHDVGKIVLTQFFVKIYRKVLMEMDLHPGLTFSELEKTYLGYSHSEIGSRLMRIWKFPDDLAESILCTYNPEKAKINPALASIVHLANVFSLSSGVGVDLGGLKENLSEYAISCLKLDDEKIGEIYSQTPEILESLESLKQF